MHYFSVSPRAAVESFWRNRELILSLSKREVLGRYKGSMLGLLWSFFNPVLMLAVYTFVFSVVFEARWGQGTGSKVEFALILFSGLLVFNLFSECVNKSATLILSHVNFVKKVVFPLEILPWVNLIAALFHTSISVLVWIIAYVVFFGLPHGTVFLLPIVLLPIVFFIMGISWALSSLGVYLRDLAQVVSLGTTMLLFLSPIFYPISAIPNNLRGYLSLNPLAPTISQVRDVLYWGEVPSFSTWSLNLLVAILVAVLGFYLFQKSRKGFADVL